MQRREVIGLLGTTACPLAAHAQQPRTPLIGLLNGVSNEAYAERIAFIRQGLKSKALLKARM